MGATHATLEQLKRAIDVAETARSNAQLLRALASATLDVDDTLLHRTFRPVVATRYFDWPNFQHAYSWRLWLDENELISTTSVTSGGVALAASDYFLEPANLGPPYTHLDVNLANSAAFSGASTRQRSIVIAGLYGYTNVETTAGTAAEALDASETGVDISDGSLIGVGDVIRIDSERMIVNGRTWLTSAQTLLTPVTASTADVTLAVTTGSAFAVDEILLLDSERMLIVDIAGNNLTVKRAWDGSVLAAHTGSTIYASRTLTVERGALGTTAASHSTSAPILRHLVPGLVNDLGLALAIERVQQESSGYARSGSSGGGRSSDTATSVQDLRERACAAHGRVRVEAI